MHHFGISIKTQPLKHIHLHLCIYIFTEEISEFWSAIAFGTVVNMPYYLRIHKVWSLLLAVGVAAPPWVSSLERRQHQVQERKLVTDQSQGCSKTYLLQEKTKRLKMVWRLWHHNSMHIKVVESLIKLFQFEINLISFLSFGAIYSYPAT